TPTPIREINSEVPDWLCDIIGKLQAKKPEERFPTAKEVAELLGQHLAHLQQPSQAPLPSPVAPTAPASPGKIGDRGVGPWDDEWSYAARVHAVKDDSVQAWFDNGEVAWVKAEDLQPLDIGPGSRVFGAWNQGWINYAGTVSQRDGHRVHIEYDDGDEEWT